MKAVKYSWGAGCTFDMVFVEGTHGHPYHFGDEGTSRPIEIGDLFIATVPVTNALWTHVIGDERRRSRGGTDLSPVEYVSWDQITQPSGFLDRINQSAVRPEIASQVPRRDTAQFRLLSETEWEYAARGGPFWRDSFTFSGSNDIGQVGWYDRNSRGRIHDVAQKAPNQVGTYDMSGNVWEWCQDAFTHDISLIPGDGMPCEGPAVERVLRGGCFNNWAIHCTVSKRYEIGRDYADESIGFRLALSIG